MLKVRIALVVTTVAWASSFTAMHLALGGFTPAHIGVLRYAVGFAALLTVARLARVTLPRGRDLLQIAATGAIGLGVYNLLLAGGQRGMPAGTASVLIATAPILMTVIAAAGGERISPRAIAGLTLGFVGVVLIKIGPGAIAVDPWPVALVLAAAALQAVYSLAQRPMVARHGALAFLTAAAGGAMVVLLPALPGAIAELGAAPPSAIAAVVWQGLVPGALGYATWAYASTRVSTAVAGTTLYAVPPTAMIIALVTLREVPSLGALAGGALILGAIALSRSVSAPASARSPRSSAGVTLAADQAAKTPA